MTLSPIIAGFGPLGTPELLIIGVLVLILFGAKKLPMFARSLGKSMGEFKKAREDFETELHKAQEEVSKPSIEDKKSEKATPVASATSENV